MIFVARCIDSSAIFGRVHALLDWLIASEEGDRLLERSEGSQPDRPGAR